MSDDRFYLMGLSYAKHRTFNKVRFSPNTGNTYTLTGLMELEQKTITLFYSQGIDALVDTWHILLLLDVGYGFPSLDSPFFTSGILSGTAMSSSGKASIRKDLTLAGRNAFIEFGIQGNIVYYTTLGDGLKVKIDKEFSYTIPQNWDNGGSTTTAQSGDSWLLESSRYDLFWGPYVLFKI